MEKLILPFAVKRKCSGKVEYLKKMKMNQSINMNEDLYYLSKKNTKLKEEIILEIEKEIPNDENRNKLINIKRDIFNNRYKRIINLDINVRNEKLKKLMLKYQENIRKILEFEEKLIETFEGEFNYSREQIQKTYSENKELVYGLKHVSLSAYEKIDKYIKTDVNKHTTSYRKFDRTLAKVMTRATFKPSPFSTFTSVGLAKLGKDDNKDKKNKDEYIIRLEVNDTFILRLFSNFLRLSEIIVNCKFSLEEKLVLDGESIAIIYEYDKSLNSKVFGTSSRYVRIPYRGNIKVLYDNLKKYKVLSMREIELLLNNGNSGNERSTISFLYKCIDNGLIKFKNKLDATQEDLLQGCIEKISEMSPRNSDRCNKLINLLESLKEYRDKYNISKKEEERFKYYKLIQKTIAISFECINYKCPLENLVYEDYIDLSMCDKKINYDILDNLNNICKISSIFDINFRTQLYFGEVFKKIFNNKLVEYKNPEIMMLLTNATKKYADLWTDEWKVNYDEENKDILLLDKKKEEFRNYLLDHRNNEEIQIKDEFLNKLIEELPPYLVERSSSMDFFIQELIDGKFVINNIYPGYLTFISRFLDYFNYEDINDMKEDYINKVFKKDYRIAEIYEVYGFNANRHKAIADYRIVFDDSKEKQNLFKNNINVQDVKLVYNDETKCVNFLDKEDKVFYPKHIGSLITVLMKGEHAFVNNIGTNVLTLPPIYKVFTEEKSDEIIKIPRVIYNNLVLSRRRWIIPYNKIPSKDTNVKLIEHFFTLREWIKNQGIPSGVYIKIEDKQVKQNNENQDSKDYSANKPQYIDFDNAILVELFDNMIKGCEYVMFEEAAPDYIKDSLGESAEEYVVEVTNIRRNING